MPGILLGARAACARLGIRGDGVENPTPPREVIHTLRQSSLRSRAAPRRGRRRPGMAFALSSRSEVPAWRPSSI